MIITYRIETNLKFGEGNEKVSKAGADALKEVIVRITRDAKADSPWLTGNNSRSIDFESEGLSGAVYSTSGYGGYLETGTVKMPARPYMKPALDRHVGEFSGLVEAKLK